LGGYESALGPVSREVVKRRVEEGPHEIYLGGHDFVSLGLPQLGCTTSAEKVLDHHRRGVGLQAKGDLEGAIAEYRAALRLHPNDVLAHFNLGTCLQAKEDIDGAIVEYRTALRLDPTYALAHTNLGKALQAKGDLALAGKEFEEALQLISQTSQNRARIIRTIPSANNSLTRSNSVHFAGDGDE
jgi:Flp pilus assembly protein TadD